MKTLATLVILLLQTATFAHAQNDLSKNEMKLSITNEDDITLLKWNTSVEVNSSYFIVERSQSDGKFEIIGTLKAGSSTYKSTSYEFEDYTDLSDSQTYRVTLVLMDGQTVSNTIQQEESGNLAKAIAK